MRILYRYYNINDIIVRLEWICSECGGIVQVFAIDDDPAKRLNYKIDTTDEYDDNSDGICRNYISYIRLLSDREIYIQIW